MRWCAALAVLGLGLFVFAPVPWLAFVALAVWGLGASLGFPVGMSAAADDPAKAAARVSVVSTIGYGAFLCGPPLLGLLAEHVGHPALAAGRHGDAGGQLPALPGGPQAPRPEPGELQLRPVGSGDPG